MGLNVLCSIFRNNFAAGRSGMRVARHRRTLNAFLLLSLSRHFSRKCHFRFVPDRIHSRSCSPVIRPARRRIVNSQIVYLDCKPSPSLRPLIADWRRFRDMFASLVRPCSWDRIHKTRWVFNDKYGIHLFSATHKNLSFVALLCLYIMSFTQTSRKILISGSCVK